MTTEPEDADFGLVMPFVVTTSNGGNLDDHAFVCGAQFGQLWHELGLYVPKSRYVHPDVVPQLDLAAMHFGYRMETDPWDDSNMLVTFTKESSDE